MRRSQMTWSGFLIQVVPMVALTLFIAACNGAPGLGDFASQPSSDVFLRGFTTNGGQATGNNNGNNPLPFIPISEIKVFDRTDTINTHQIPTPPGTCGFENKSGGESGETDVDTLFPTIFAVMSVSNGVSAILESITIQFTEFDGSPLQRRCSLPGGGVLTGTPITVGGQYDFIMRTHLSIEAPPITSFPSGLGDLTGQIGNVLVPINVWNTNVYCDFLFPECSSGVGGGCFRPILVKFTMAGEDILGHPFSIVSFLPMSVFFNGAATTGNP